MAKKKREQSKIMESDDLSPVEVPQSAEPAAASGLDDAELDDLLGQSESKEVAKTSGATKLIPSASSNEMKEKIDSLEKHCIELEEANAKLTDSINTYLEEIDDLKKKDKTAEVDNSLKKSLDDANQEISKLKKELKELRQENDDYLIKISELTFENAKMTSRLQEIEKQAAMTGVPTHGSPIKPGLKPSTATIPNQPQFANPYLRNGYQDW